MGVQFASIPTYSSVHANSIRDLFKDEFPKTQEQPLLDPNFETFGGANPQPEFQLRLTVPTVGSRLWFLSKDENHLLQFQTDRFLTNWRKHPIPQDYPRFEGISASFKSNLLKLEKLLKTNLSYTLEINQAEIVYVNIISVDEFSDASEWFSVWNEGLLNIESLNTSFNEIIKDNDEKPYARLSHEIQSVLSVDGKHKAFRLSLTFRGKPPLGSGIDAAVEFLKDGRDRIVTRFDEITTKKAHKFWDKIQ